MIFKFAFSNKMYEKAMKIKVVSSEKENLKHFSLATCFEYKIEVKRKEENKYHGTNIQCSQRKPVNLSSRKFVHDWKSLNN